MKRFFIIFIICFAAVIGVIAGVYGIKYLKGDFNEIVVNPENISFEFDEYDVVDDFTVKITTTTEDVTATNVTLSFAKGTVTNTHGANHLTDGVIIIPKQVKIGEEFEIKLVKTIDAELNNLEWIKGGISNIVATSECVTTPKDTASVYVDVPVYKTEIVVLSGEGQVNADSSYVDILTYIEGQNGLIKSTEKSLNSGDTFYVGLKFYPVRSAYKYSKASSTNLLVEYQDQILAKLEDLGLTQDYSEKFEELNNLFSSEQETTSLSINQLFELYTDIVTFSTTSNSIKYIQFVQYLSELNSQFEQNLKYFTYEEAANNEQTYTTKINRINGTNIYKVQTTTNSVLLQSGVTANLYAYTFANAKIETDTLAVVGNNYSNLLSTFENLYSEQGLELKNKKVDKATLSLDIVDVDVDTINIDGEIQDFPVNKIHTLYLAKQGEGNQNNSYLNLVLKNSNVDNVDLQNKLFNVGIRFEKRVTTNTWNNAEELSFVNSQNYTTVEYDGKTYYLPLGSSVGYLNSYWQIYSDNYVSNDIRAVLVYFKGDLLGEILAEQIVSAIEYPIFKLEDPIQTEQMVKWDNISSLTLGVVDITGTVDMSVLGEADAEETLKNVSYNTEIDLNQYIDIPAENYYQTYKFFLYSDDYTTNVEPGAEKPRPISDYFYVTDQKPKQYPFYGTIKNLYELDGNILKLKSSEWPTDYTVKIIFATIKTGALRTPMLEEYTYSQDNDTYIDNRYTFVKYSAVKDNVVENLSYISLNFTGSIKELSGTVSNALRENSIEEDLAGVAEDNLFKVAQNAQNALIVTVECQQQDASLVKSAIDSGNLRLEALTSKTGAENYITYTTEYVSGINYFVVSTKTVSDEDVTVRLYLVYNVDGEEYLFPVKIIQDTTTYHKLTIVKNTSETAYFRFSTNSGSVDINEINYIEVVTDYGNKDGEVDTQTFTKTYYVYYKDGRDSDNLDNRRLYISDIKTNKVIVEVIDFLGNTRTDIFDWYLTSSNLEVATITDGQIINFVGSDANPVEIGLYINNGTLQQSVKFVVNETGYVAKVVENPEKDTERTIFEYDEKAPKPTKYTFVKQTISVDEASGAEVQIDDLLRIFYKLNAEVDSNKLPMLAYISNEDSLNALKQIASGTTLSGIKIEELTLIPSDDNYFEKHAISTITLKEDLGSVVTIDMVYVCAELGLTQAVSAKFNQTIAISDVSITNCATGNKISINNSVYDIYAGLDYDIALTSSAPNLYYYFDGESNVANIQTINDKIFNIKFEDGSTTQKKIHITDKKIFTIDSDGNRIPGRLDYVLEFNVQKNVSLITTNAIDKELEGNTLNIDLLEIFERLTAITAELPENATNPNLKNYPILGVIGFDKDSNYAPDNSKITNISLYTNTNFDGGEENRKIVITFGEFINSLDIKFYVKCNGEIVGGAISLHIVPDNLQKEDATVFTYYKGNKSIIVSNGQTVKSNNTDFFKSLFEEGDVVCGDDFYNTFTVTEGPITKVVLSTDNLFEDTNTSVTVTKDKITTEYKIIVSKLAFPFVQFNDLEGNPLSYENLDINYLFENTQDILNYYNSNNIASFVPSAIDDETDALLLVNTEDDTNAVIKLYPNGRESTISNAVNFNNLLGSIQVLQGSLTANHYANLTHTSTDLLTGNILLDINPVGEDVYLKVNVHVMANGSSTYYEIPVVVKLNVTQTLKVTYPFSNYNKDSNDKYYGSEEYDNLIMLESSSTFEEFYKYMEYLSFDINGLASIDLLDSNYNRFNVYKGNNLDTNYNDGFTFKIENISKNANGVWSFIEQAQLVNYAYFENNLLTSTNGILNISNALGGIAFRVKIKATTQGGAVSYYYVSAGEQVPLTLNRQSNNANVSVGKTDSITISSGNILLIGGGKEGDYAYNAVSPTFNYYISNANYNKEIKFRLFDELGRVISSDNLAKYAEIDNNKLTIAVQPMGINFKIQIYTSYGVLTTVSVTVENSVTVNLTSNTIYSGTTYDFAEIINIIPGAGINNIQIVSVVSKQPNPLFTCEGEFIFANIPAGQTQVFDMVLTISIKIDSLVEPFTFEHTFNSVHLVPRFVAKAFDNGFYRDDTEKELTTYTENSGKIEIINEIWAEMFKDLKTNAGLDVSQESEQLRFFIEGIDITEFVKDQSIAWTLNYVLTDEETRNWTFTIKDLSGQTLAFAYAKITVKPQYTVVLNYPKVINEIGAEVIGLTYEYVQNNGTIAFDAPNFSNSENRILVYESETNEIYNEYSIEFEGQYGEYTSKVTGDKTGFTFEFATNDFANKTEIECRFNVKINDKIYATYVVKVIKDSPFALQTDYMDTIYYGYGHTNEELFTRVDVYVTLPSLQKFSLGQQIDLYVDNGSITRIAEGVYYRAGDKIHGILPITNYTQDLKVYICTKGGGELGMDDPCHDVEFKVRATLKYNVYDIQYKHYTNILGDVSSTKISELDHITTNSVSIAKNGVLSIVSSTNIAQNIYVDFTYDINIGNEYSTENNALILNANQVENGQSFIELFNVKDSLGNQFWYNQVGGTRKIRLIVKDIDGAMECLPVYPQTIGDETLNTFDYLLKPLGAKNKGTLCELTFTYIFQERSLEYTKKLYVKVISDIEFQVYNNDGTSTPNSKTNPLKINASSGNITFVSANQNQYIYAYSKFASEKTNIAQQMIYTVEKLTDSATDYITITKLTSPTAFQIQIKKQASFGNKTIQLVLTDMYGFTIDYYIELIADVNVTSISTIAGKVYEGESITVYNKNIAGAGGSNGSVAITLNRGSDKDTSTKIKVYKEETTFWLNGSTYYSDTVIKDINESVNGTGIITFNFLPYDEIWDTTKDLSNGYSFTGTLHIVIGNGSTNTDEKYSFDISFTLFKKYSFEILPENTFVREGVEVDLTHFVDVYDYSQESYLGKPILTKNEEISVNLPLNYGSNTDLRATKEQTLYNLINNTLNDINNNTLNVDKIEDYWDDLAKYGIQSEGGISGASVIANQDSYKTGLYTDYLVMENDVLKTYHNGTLTPVTDIPAEKDSDGNSMLDENGNKIVYVRKQDGSIICKTKYDISNLGIYLKVVAVHKTNGSQIEQVRYTYIKHDGNGKYFIEYREPLGSDTSKFGKNITTQNYFFKIYMCEIGEIIKTGKLVASTLQSELDEVKDNQGRTPIASGNLYHVDITNSKEMSGNIGLALVDVNDLDTVYLISNYIIKSESGQYSDDGLEDITKERRTFYLYNGEYNAIKYSKIDDSWTLSSENYQKIQIDKFERATLNLYTGKINNTVYINGLSATDSKTAKNIEGITYDKESEDGSINTVEDLTYTGRLNSDVFDYSSEFKIDYQSDVLKNVKVIYSEFGDNPSKPENPNATETHADEYMNVTLKYTGVNTENAYIASQVHYVYINGLELDENGALTGDKNISFKLNDRDDENKAYWAEGFELATGYGIANTLAGSEDKRFIGSNTNESGDEKFNVESLSFEVGELKGTTEIAAKSLFTVNEDNGGDITLLKDFVPNSYYISIIVKCNYGSNNQSKEIGTIYLAFVAVDELTIDSIGNNQYKVDITKYVEDQEILTEQVKLEGSVTTKVYKESNKRYAIFEVTNITQFTTRKILTIGATSRSVFFNEINYIETPETITLYRLSENQYAILGDDISVYDNSSKSIVNDCDYLGNMQISIGYNDLNADLTKEPANLGNSSEVIDKEYFEFTISDSGVLTSSNRQYYVSYNGAYCPVIIKLEEVYLKCSFEVTISDSNQFNITNLQLSNDIWLNDSDLTLKIDNTLISVEINGDVTFNNYSSDKSIYILSVTDNETYNILLKITR